MPLPRDLFPQNIKGKTAVEPLPRGIRNVKITIHPICMPMPTHARLRIAPGTTTEDSTEQREKPDETTTVIVAVIMKKAATRNALVQALSKTKLDDGTSIRALGIDPKKTEELNKLSEEKIDIIACPVKSIVQSNIRQWIDKTKKNVAHVIILYDLQSGELHGEEYLQDIDEEQTIHRNNIVIQGRNFGCTVFLDITQLGEENDEENEEYAPAVKAARDGEMYASPSIASKLGQVFIQSGNNQSEQYKLFDELLFTDRELEVVKLIIFRQSNKEIAKTLEPKVSRYTVKNHVHNILEKLAQLCEILGIELTSELRRDAIQPLFERMGLVKRVVETNQTGISTPTFVLRTPEEIRRLSPNVADAMARIIVSRSKASKSGTPDSGSRKAEDMKRARETGDDE